MSIPEPAPRPGRHVVVGAGPIGRHVAHHLEQAGHEVVVLSRSGTDVGAGRPVAVDLLDRGAASRIAVGAATITFAAQPDYTRWPEEFPALHDAAIDLAATTDAVLVAVENTYGYGDVDGILTEDRPLVATSRKGATRAAMSNTLFAAHAAGRIRAVAGRASDFFGPEVRGSAVGELFFSPIVAGQTVMGLADVDQAHSFTYAPDFAAALVRLGADERAWGRAWHVPTADPLTPRAFVIRASAIAETSPEVVVVPRADVEALAAHDPMMRELAEQLYEWERPHVLDWGDYRATFGGSPTPLDEALAATVAWFRTEAVTR